LRRQMRYEKHSSASRTISASTACRSSRSCRQEERGPPQAPFPSSKKDRCKPGGGS
jgi:hypothetical protein